MIRFGRFCLQVLCFVLVGTGVAAAEKANSGAAVSANSDKTLVFDHQLGKIISPIPAQLQVQDGDVFVIQFINTDPTRFNYELKGVGSADISSVSFKEGTESVSAGDLTDVTVTWRHDRHFPLYQVTVSPREGGVAPKVAHGVKPNDTQEAGGGAEHILYSYTFPVWIKTIGWDLSFTSGIAFSRLVNDKFFIMTAADGSKTVQRSSSAGDSLRPDFVALANLRVPENWRYIGSKLGLAFGLGLNGDGDTRYFFGPSWTLGKAFILTGGWAGGKIISLPPGQSLNKPPINGDNTLSSLGSRFASSWFVGISFTFTNKETEFLGALAPAQKVETPKAAAAKPMGKNPE